ncbi:uncharacterized protein [Mytilus edulis]|uniref:uncharacterized protein n=1 Tax=Mytilus edulis TaxID=6550 RepID=UPI0039EFFB0A
MYKIEPDTLRVYTESENTTQLRWSQNGSNLNQWNFASFTISISEPYRIIFEGVRGSGYWSVLAIDDISLLERSCSAAETPIVTAETFSSFASSAGDDTTVTTISSVINAREDNSLDDTTVYAVVVPTLVIIIAVALIFTVIVCHLKKRTKSSKLCDVRPITTVTETIDSSGYNIINYNNMTGISIHEKEKNRHEMNANNCQPEDIRTAIKQEDTIGNKYESLSTNRNPSEHAYESDPIHTNQYQTLTKQQESDKHFYESTEPAQAQAQDNNTLTGQEDDICHKYEFLSANRNSVEHAYELDVLHTNQYESLTKQREYDKHTYESTETAQEQDIKTLTGQEDGNCHKYESLSTNRNSAEHIYESDSIHNIQYEPLTNQQESNEHTNQSNGYELPVSMKQELSQ